MKILLTGFFLMFTCFLAFSQKNSSLDSLMVRFDSEKNNTSTLQSILDYYQSRNIDSLNLYANRLLVIALAEKDKKLAYEVTLKRVNGYILLNENEGAKAMLDTLVLDEDSEPLIYINYKLAQGRLLNRSFKYDEALAKFYEAVQAIRDHQLDALLAETYAEIASILVTNIDLENSTKYFRFAFEEAKKRNNVEVQIKVCYALCRAYNGALLVNLDSSVHYGALGMEIVKMLAMIMGMPRW